MYYANWCAVIPLANEEHDSDYFFKEMTQILDRLRTGTVYLIVDKVSKDNTWNICKELAEKDPRYVAVWAPENKNVVDAYLRGFREAYSNGHEIIIEMDSGMSHDPKAIPMFLRVLQEGNECAFGSRFINGGSMTDSPLKRRLLSRGGTLLTNLFLNTHLKDMTSGYQGFHSHIIGKLLEAQLLSKAHFYQTEVRYLLRRHRHFEVPIHYKAPSPRVSNGAILNSFSVLFYYAIRRYTGKAVYI
jgi:dolichol-phosphate mannosyltransferase